MIIVLDADQMNQMAANAFLKSLEEPQRDTTFILVTERVHKLLDTIRSRCQLVSFSYLDADELAGDSMKVRKVSRADADIAAEVSEGSFRRALEYLERPDDFIVPAARDFFIQTEPGPDDCRRLSDQADRLPVETLIDSLLFLYGQALRVCVGLASRYVEQDPKLAARVEKLGVALIRRRLEILLKAKREFEYNVNRKLFLFSLLVALAANPKS